MSYLHIFLFGIILLCILDCSAPASSSEDATLSNSSRTQEELQEEELQLDLTYSTTPAQYKDEDDNEYEYEEYYETEDDDKFTIENLGLTTEFLLLNPEDISDISQEKEGIQEVLNALEEDLDTNDKAITNEDNLKHKILENKNNSGLESKTIASTTEDNDLDSVDNYSEQRNEEEITDEDVLANEQSIETETTKEEQMSTKNGSPEADRTKKLENPKNIRTNEIKTKESINTVAEKYSSKIKDFYKDCDRKKKCFGEPKYCMWNASCQVVVSFKPNQWTGVVSIELLGNTSKYIALGFSNDTFMGDDNVIECQRQKGDSIVIYRSFNTKEHNNIRLNNHSAINNTKGIYENGYLYCSFNFQYKTELNTGYENLTFDLQNSPYYLFLARGGNQKHNGIGYHDLGYSSTTEQHNVYDEHHDVLLRRWLEKLHGILIIIAWIVLAPISMFVTRYFKDTWNRNMAEGFSIWFLIHIILNGSVVSLTMLSLLLILIPLKSGSPGSHGWNHHNISGILMIIFMFLQIGIGIKVFKFMNDEAHRFIVPRVHGILGHLLYFLTIGIIFMSLDIRHGLPCCTFPVLIIWIICYFLIHLLISYQICYLDYITGIQMSTIHTTGGLPSRRIITSGDPEPPGGKVRRILFGILCVVCTTTAIFIIGFYLAGYQDCKTKAGNK